MENLENQKVLPTLRFGNVDFTLFQGDLFAVKSDVFLCQVDEKLQTREGLFGVLKKENALPKEIILEKGKLPLGQVKMIKCYKKDFSNLIIASVISSIGLVDRAVIAATLMNALEIADVSNFQTFVTPLLGVAQAHSNYEIICGVMLKTIKEFGLKKVRNLNKVILSIYNPQAYYSCQNVFFSFQQTMGISDQAGS